jgi:hypothetical protein
MSKISVAHYSDVMQEYELIRLNVSNVFCPMCEVWHENNTFCQIPTEGGLV